MFLWICTAFLSPYPDWAQLLHAAHSMGGTEPPQSCFTGIPTDAPCAPSITYTSKGDLYHLSSPSPSLAVPQPVIPWQHRRSATSSHYSFRGTKKCGCILLLIYYPAALRLQVWIFLKQDQNLLHFKQMLAGIKDVINHPGLFFLNSHLFLNIHQLYTRVFLSICGL